VSTAPDAWRRPRPQRRLARRSPRRVALRAFLASVAAGPVVGLVWWVLSPGGRRPAGSTYLELVQSVGETDGAFALTCLGAGAVAGLWWVVVREPEHDSRAVGRLVGLLVGGLVGAAVAWGSGWVIDVVAGSADVEGVSAEVAAELAHPRLSAATLAGVLLWPLAVGVLVVVDTVRDTVARALRSDGPAY
jgi:hypothetical protein